jgi:hypothetical protein
MLPSHTRQIELTPANSHTSLTTEICNPHPLTLALISGSSSRAPLCKASLLRTEVTKSGHRLYRSLVQSAENCQIAIHSSQRHRAHNAFLNLKP